jgi:hypothetical protein
MLHEFPIDCCLLYAMRSAQSHQLVLDMQSTTLFLWQLLIVSW